MSTVFDIVNNQYRVPPIQQPNPQIQNGSMMGRLQQFAGTLNGNPEEIVRGLLKSGRMSQQQFNKLSQQASQIQQIFGLR